MNPEPSDLAANPVPPTPPALASVSGYDALVTDLEIVKQKLESIRSNLSDNPADVEYQANDDVWWAIQSVDNAIGNLRAS